MSIQGIGGIFMDSNNTISVFQQICNAFFATKGISEENKSHFLFSYGKAEKIKHTSQDAEAIKNFLESFFVINVYRVDMKLLQKDLLQFDCIIFYVDFYDRRKDINTYKCTGILIQTDFAEELHKKYTVAVV